MPPKSAFELKISFVTSIELNLSEYSVTFQLHSRVRGKLD